MPLAQSWASTMAVDKPRATASSAIPAPVIYALTEYGETVLPLVENARVWGNRHIARARASYPPGTRETLNCTVTR